MKKYILFFPLVALLAAGCGKSSNSSSIGTNNSGQAPAAQQAPAQMPSTANPPMTATPPASQFKTVNAPMPNTPYSSTADNFSINFPEAPKITNSTFPSPSAGPIPVTQYRAQYLGSGEYAYYTVYVYHYPASYKFASDYLNTALQTFIKIAGADFPGTEVTSQQPTKFLGNPALSALITIPIKSAPGSSSTVNTPDYFLATINKQNLYIISTYGMDQSNYNAFIGSFKLGQ